MRLATELLCVPCYKEVRLRVRRLPSSTCLHVNHRATAENIVRIEQGREEYGPTSFNLSGYVD